MWWQGHITDSVCWLRDDDNKYCVLIQRYGGSFHMQLVSEWGVDGTPRKYASPEWLPRTIETMEEARAYALLQWRMQ